MQDLSLHRTPFLPSSPAEQRDYLFEERGVAHQLQHYWSVIWRYRWTILAIAFLMAIVAALVIVMKEPLYTATTTIQIQSQSPNVAGVSDVFAVAGGNGVLAGNYDYYQTQFNLLQSRSLVARVIQDLKLEQDPRFRKAETLPSLVKKQMGWFMNATVNPLIRWIQESLGLANNDKVKPTEFELDVNPDLIDLYLSMLAVNPVKKSQLVEVQFSSVDPALSQAVTNAHVAAFIRMNLQTRFELSTEARQFLEEKLQQLKEKVVEAEAALNRFRKTYGIVSLEKGENLLVEDLMIMNRNLTEARSKRIDLESLYHVVQQKDDRLLSQVIDNRFVQQLKDQIAGVEAEKARLGTKFKSTYPGIVSLQEQIDQAKTRLDRELSRIVHTIESDYTAAKTKEEALTTEMEKRKQEALDLREKEIEYAILEREAQSNRTLYENVLSKTKETTLAGEVPVSNMEITDRAEIPLRPDGTSNALILLASMIVGLLGGTGLAFFRSFLDDTLSTPEQIEQYLRIPTLGLVPDLKSLQKKIYTLDHAKKVTSPESQAGQVKTGKDLVTSYHPFSLVVESYRVIRTAVLFARAERPPQTILIASAQPNEGKTVTAINLAISLAQTSDRPVLLVDADLRKGSCHERLGMANGNGLTNVLTGNIRIAEPVKKTAIDNLYLLCRGELAPNPAELLGSEKMRETLEDLKVYFSFIVIDSAPLIPLVDTVLLSTMVDGVVLVVKAQETPHRICLKARERLDYVKAKVIGAVLNSVDMRHPDYGTYKEFYRSYYTNFRQVK